MVAVPIADPRRFPRPVREQTRARYPDHVGVAIRDGGRIAYEVYGAGDPPIVFVPPWQIVHARVWKAQIPDFARRHRVVAWDARGNGQSDRPLDPAAHTGRARAADLGAVMDAADVRAAVLVGLSSAATPMVIFAAEHPERVTGLVFICPSTPLGTPGPEADVPFEEPSASDEGWNRENLHSWRRDFRGYLEFFFGEALPEPHSTKHREDSVSWGLDTDPESLAATMRAPASVDLASYRELCAAIRVPALVIQGTDERITDVSQGVGLAETLPRARLELLRGAGHIPNARHPVRINLLVRDFVDSLGATPSQRGELRHRRAAPTVEAAARSSTDRRGEARGRARLPHTVGIATADDGIRLGYEIYGMRDPTILFLPSAPIVHARQWKAQIHYLSRSWRVVAYDGRGNGRSDRPTVPEAYHDDRFVADVGTVMDATGTGRAVLVGLCVDGVWRAIRFAAEHPDRVLGIVGFGIGVPRLAALQPHYAAAAETFHEALPAHEGWAKMNAHYWRRDYEDWLRFFFSEILSESHSSKAIEDAVSWGLDGSVEAMLADSEAEFPFDLEQVEGICRAVRSPMLLVHGTDDTCQLPARAQRLAELTGAPLVMVEGADHMIPGRHPVLANLLIADFIRSRVEVSP